MNADAKGVKVLSLGLLNQVCFEQNLKNQHVLFVKTKIVELIVQFVSVQGEELNRNGELYIGSNSKLKVKVVDGSSLVVAIVINSIPKGTTKVLFRGRPSKVSYAIVSALCNMGIKVYTRWPICFLVVFLNQLLILHFTTGLHVA